VEQLLESELAAFGASATGAGALLQKPSDLSEPSGLAPSVSIKQTTVLLPLHHPAFQCDNPTASAGNSRVALSESTSAIAWSFYIISVFYQPSCNFNFCLDPLVMGLSFLKSSCIILNYEFYYLNCFNNNYCLFCTRILALTARPIFNLVEASRGFSIRK
jgi:hypothetical protein